MTQQVINVGTAPNDGAGDPIRTAFIKTNNNFAQLFGATLPNNIVNGTSTVSINTANGNVSFNVANVSNVMVVTANSVAITADMSASGDVTIAGLLKSTQRSPASTSTGTVGQICWDADYIYVCTATDTWARTPLTGGY